MENENELDDNLSISGPAQDITGEETENVAAENDENIDEADEEELEQIKSALEEEDGSGKYRNMLSIFPKN